MPITIDHLTKEIQVSKNETVFLENDSITGREKRSLDITAFGKALADVQDNEDEVWASTAYDYTQQKTVGGIFLAPVLTINSPYKITFEDGPWAVFLVNGNTNLQDRVTVNQVSVFPSNSGGLVGSTDIANQSYIDGSVFIDTVDGVAGTGYPNGTPTNPVNNYEDAYFIASVRNLHGYNLFSDNLVLTSLQNIERTKWMGVSTDSSKLTLSGSSNNNAVFEHIRLTGIANGKATYKQCVLDNISGIEGTIRECSLYGTITLNNTSGAPITFIKPDSYVAGTNTPIIDFNDITADVQFRGVIGGITLKNITQNISVSFDGLSSRLIIDPSCTAGTIVVRGMVQLENNSAGSTVITDGTVTNLVQTSSTSITQGDIDAITDAIWSELVASQAAPDSFGDIITKLYQKATELHKIQGLDITAPMTMTLNSRTAGDIELEVTGDLETFTQVHRQ